MGRVLGAHAEQRAGAEGMGGGQRMGLTDDGKHVAMYSERDGNPQGVGGGVFLSRGVTWSDL